MRNFSIKKRGFTLVEVLAVVAIVSILASVALANMQSGKFKARDTQRISDLQQVQVALRTYRDLNSTAYPTGSGVEIGSGSSAIDTLIAPFVSDTIRDPLYGTTGYSYYYNDSYSCGGTHIVLVALKMEGSAGNFSDKCGAGPYPAVATGATPTTDSYIVILK